MTARPRPHNRAANAHGRTKASRSKPKSSRRLLVALLAVVVVSVAAIAIYPQFNKAVNELTLPLNHEDIIRQQAKAKKLSPELIAAVIYAESRFRDQTSSAGARGLMQITPATAQYIADLSGGTAFQLKDLGTPQTNISYGSYYLRYLLNRYGGNETLALAAYNAGEGNVDQWLGEAGRRGKAFGVDNIPFPETRHYVERVIQAQADYRSEYAKELGL